MKKRRAPQAAAFAPKKGRPKAPPILSSATAALAYLRERRAYPDFEMLLSAARAAKVDGQNYLWVREFALSQAHTGEALKTAGKSLARTCSLARDPIREWGPFGWSSDSLASYSELATRLLSAGAALESAANHWLEPSQPKQRRKRGLLTQEPWRLMAKMANHAARGWGFTLPTTKELAALEVATGLVDHHANQAAALDMWKQRHRSIRNEDREFALLRAEVERSHAREALKVEQTRLQMRSTIGLPASPLDPETLLAHLATCTNSAAFYQALTTDELVTLARLQMEAETDPP